MEAHYDVVTSAYRAPACEPRPTDRACVNCACLSMACRQPWNASGCIAVLEYLATYNRLRASSCVAQVSSGLSTRWKPSPLYAHCVPRTAYSLSEHKGVDVVRGCRTRPFEQRIVFRRQQTCCSCHEFLSMTPPSDQETPTSIIIVASLSTGTLAPPPCNGALVECLSWATRTSPTIVKRSLGGLAECQHGSHLLGAAHNKATIPASTNVAKVTRC
jgi:hypothetical protein